MRIAAFVVLSATITFNQVDAATLSTVSGDVLVNTGRGFQRGATGQDLAAGDRVMIGQMGGTAIIAYGPHCEERVEVGHVVTVRPQDACAGKTESDITTGSNPAAGGLAAGGMSTGTMVAGGAAIAAGVGLGIANASKSKKPASN